MDKFMFWRKKKRPEDSAAQHLANLIGTSVAGFAPEPPYDKVDLESELFRRNNMAIAELVIISGLIKGNQAQRASILQSVKPEQFRERSFESYLFRLISDELRDKGDIPLIAIEKAIPNHSQVDWGEPASERSLKDYAFKWSQILSFEPTEDQIGKAIEMLQNKANAAATRK